MPSVAIYGDSGMGKTMLMQRFLAEHRSTFNRATGTERTPVLSLQMVNRPNEKRFYSQLMDVIGAPRIRARASRISRSSSFACSGSST